MTDEEKAELKETIREELRDVICNEYSVPKEILFPNKKSDLKHLSKSWLEETCEKRMMYEKDYLKEESEHIYNSTKYGIKEFAKKILEKITDSLAKEQLSEIIKELGVEI